MTRGCGDHDRYASAGAKAPWEVCRASPSVPELAREAVGWIEGKAC